MAGAPYLDFLGESPKGAAAPKPAAVKKPKTDAAADAKARATIEATKKRIADEKRVTNLATIRNEQYKIQREEAAMHARLMADPGPEGQAYRARYNRIHSAGVDWGLIPLGAAVIGTGAAIIGTGGAAAGALGLAAGAGVATTGAAVSQAASLLGNATRGDVPTAALKQLGGEAVASLNLPKAIKVSVPEPKQAVAAARSAVGGAKAAVSAAVKTPVGAAVKAAAPLIAPPKTAPVKVLTQALTAGASSLVKPPAAAQAAASSLFSAAAAGASKLPGLGKGTKQLREKLTATQRKLLDSDAGAYIVQSKSGALSVQTTSKKPPAPGAASTPAATMFSSALTGAIKQVAVAASGVKPPVVQVPNKTPIGPKTPPAGVAQPPPAALPAMADPIAVPVPTPAPPPPTVAPALPAPPAYATGLVPEKPIVRGLLVRLDGTIDSDTDAWRAA